MHCLKRNSRQLVVLTRALYPTQTTSCNTKNSVSSNSHQNPAHEWDRASSTDQLEFDHQYCSAAERTCDSSRCMRSDSARQRSCLPLRVMIRFHLSSCTSRPLPQTEPAGRASGTTSQAGGGARP